MTKEEIDKVLKKCKELGIDISNLPEGAEITDIKILEDENGEKYASINYTKLYPERKNEQK